MFSTFADVESALYPFSIGYNYKNYGSLYSIVRNCLADEKYIGQRFDFYKESIKTIMGKKIKIPFLDVYDDPQATQLIRDFADRAEERHDPPAHTFHNMCPDNITQWLITPWLDGYWYEEIRGTSDSHFNTVNHPDPQNIDDNFEVISYVDELTARWCGTWKSSSYFFTYDTNKEGGCVTLQEWINYLDDITKTYAANGNQRRPIKTLTIFAHGDPGIVHMSDGFSLDLATVEEFRQLREKGILSNDDPSILLFSCEVAAKDKKLVQKLADVTGLLFMQVKIRPAFLIVIRTL